MEFLKVAEIIRERIITGDWPSDRKILSPEDLTLIFGVGIQTVRDAITHLHQRGYLATAPRRGTYVRPPLDWETENEPCMRKQCRQAPELGRLFGHDSIAHSLINRLVREDITTESQLHSISDQDLMDIRGIGPLLYDKIRQKAPYDGFGQKP